MALVSVGKVSLLCCIGYGVVAQAVVPLDSTTFPQPSPSPQRTCCYFSPASSTVTYAVTPNPVNGTPIHASCKTGYMVALDEYNNGMGNASKMVYQVTCANPVLQCVYTNAGTCPATCHQADPTSC